MTIPYPKAQEKDFLVPSKVLNEISQKSNETAAGITNQAITMAGNYLQGMKQMTGADPNKPLRTVSKVNTDIDNALKRASAYIDATGKVPDMPFLQAVGLTGTYGPAAGQKTFGRIMEERAMALEEQALALRSAGGGGGGGGGGGRSGGATKTSGSSGGYNAVLKKMIDGQERHRQAYLRGENRAPHNYEAYVRYAIEQGQINQSQAKSLMAQANYMTKADYEYTKRTRPKVKPQPKKK